MSPHPYLVTGPWILQVFNNKSADPGHQQGGARQRKSTTSSTTTPAPAAPSEHKARRSGTCSFARAEAAFLDAWQEGFGASFWISEGNVKQ